MAAVLPVGINHTVTEVVIQIIIDYPLRMKNSDSPFISISLNTDSQLFHICFPARLNVSKGLIKHSKNAYVTKQIVWLPIPCVWPLLTLCFPLLFCPPSDLFTRVAGLHLQGPTRTIHSPQGQKSKFTSGRETFYRKTPVLGGHCLSLKRT